MARAPINPLISVIGATGTGKSKLAVALARRFGGEIINGDALQLYEGLPIVTNKIRISEMCGVKHHLLGRLGLDEEPWTVSQFTPEALRIIESVKSRGKVPILVGGTHYYIQSLLLREQTLGTNKLNRLSAAEQEERWPILKASEGEILEKLREVDPEMAARWHPKESRRIRRSLEIWLQTGKKASEIYANQLRKASETAPFDDPENTYIAEGEGLLRYNSLTFCTYASKDDLDIRLADRVEEMLSEGLVEEVQLMRRKYQELLAGPVPVDPTRGIWVAIGYRQFTDYLAAVESGTATQEKLDELRADAIERTKIATRQYARQQTKWIKNKLLPMILQAGGDDAAILLDCTTTSAWAEKVEEPAIALTDDFLNARPLQVTVGMKHLLTQLLAYSKANNSSRLLRSVTCDVCGVTMTSQIDLDKHARTSRHKRALGVKRNDDPSRNTASNVDVNSAQLGDTLVEGA